MIHDTRQATPIDLNRRSTAGDAVTAYLRVHADRLRAAELAVRVADPEGVHDMRVAVSRLRGVLRAFRSVYRKVDRGRVGRLRDELKWLSDVLGQVRDAEVLQRRLSEEVDATPTELVLGPVAAALDRYLAKDAATTRADLLSTLDSARYADLVAGLEKFTARPPTSGRAGKRGADVLPPLVAKAYRRASRAAEAAEHATGPARDDALHRVRRAVKRVRYAAEATAPVAGRPADRYRRRSRQVQRVLGDHHDYVVLRRTLRDLGVRAHLDNLNSFTFGLLHGRIGMAAMRRDREFTRRWRKLASRKARRWLRT